MPATLMALRDAGWRVVNLACGLGRPAQHQRRRAEVEEACRRAGFELLPCEPPLPLSAGDDLAAAEETLVKLLGAVLPALDPALVCAPSPHDGHHAHEVVGRAARPRARGPPRPGAAALAVGRVGRPAVPDADRALRPRAARRRSSTRSRRTPPSWRDCPSTGWSRRAPSSTPASARSACTARGSRAIPRSSSPSCSARSCSTPAGWQLGSPRRFDAEAPIALALGAADRLVAREPSRCTRACAARRADRDGSAHVGAQRVAGDQEPALDELDVALEGAILVLDRDPAVVADGVERGAEAIPAHLAEARAGAAPASSGRRRGTPCS